MQNDRIAGHPLRHRRAKKLRVLGIMSGTSLDSVDYALCDIDPTRVELRHYWQAKFPKLLQQRLERAARGALVSHEIAQLHHDLGRFYAIGARQGMTGRKAELVGVHGQTIFHNPGRRPATFQLGESAYLVEALRVPVVSNFRAADLAAGGQGAPLATLFHRVVFGRPGEHVCVNNLGGISNVTSIDRRKNSQFEMMSFDTGPGNMLIDLAVRGYSDGRRRFDRGGRWARFGRASTELLDSWLKHPFFLKPPPKSTGREVFGEALLATFMAQGRKAGLSKFEVIATLTELTARSLALNYRLHLGAAPDRVVLAGGGALNPVLTKCIRMQLEALNPIIRVETCDELGWPVQSVEPAAFGLLAYYRLNRIPGNIPSTTGAARSALLGQIAEP